MHEVKLFNQSTKEINDRTVIGIAAVHGNVDDGFDRSWPGSFADIQVNGRDRARFLWQHNSMEPPTAVINYIKEVSRAELPDTVLSYAPDATGGVEVSRTYIDTLRGNEILAGLRAGAIQEMSYAYEVKQFDFEEVEGRMIRNIRKVAIFDFSDVSWGMNPATVAVKGLYWKARPLADYAEAVKADLEAFSAWVEELKERRLKEGRILSGENRKRIEDAIGSLKEATDALQGLLAATEPKAAPVPAPAIATPETISQLYAQYQRTLASINGVRL